MTNKRVLYLRGRQQREALRRWPDELPDGWRVEAREPTRSMSQNDLLHSLFDQVSKAAKWQDRTLTPTQWKVLFISAHAQATGLEWDVVEGLEGEPCNIRESSASMSVARMSSLIEYVQSWATVNEIPIKVQA